MVIVSFGSIDKSWSRITSGLPHGFPQGRGPALKGNGAAAKLNKVQRAAAEIKA